MVSLLLSGLNEKFRNVIRMEELMSLRMEQMKKLQSGDAAAVKSGAAGRRCGAVSAEAAATGAHEQAAPMPKPAVLLQTFCLLLQRAFMPSGPGFWTTVSYPALSFAPAVR